MQFLLTFDKKWFQIGAVIIFTGINSMIFLKARLKWFQWTGMFVVLGGLLITGLPDLLYPEEGVSKTNYSLHWILLKTSPDWLISSRKRSLIFSDMLQQYNKSRPTHYGSSRIWIRRLQIGTTVPRPRCWRRRRHFKRNSRWYSNHMCTG